MTISGSPMVDAVADCEPSGPATTMLYSAQIEKNRQIGTSMAQPHESIRPNLGRWRGVFARRWPRPVVQSVQTRQYRATITLTATSAPALPVVFAVVEH